MLNSFYTQDIISNGVSISMDYDKLLFQIEGVGSLNDDYINYAINFARLNIFNFNSILIGGLGFGLLPYYIENNTSANSIDVIEKNLDVITATTQFGHLKNTNIVHHDFLTYTTDKKYDLILVDLWWTFPTNEEVDTIVSNYTNNLNENGSIYFPTTSKIYN